MKINASLTSFLGSIPHPAVLLDRHGLILWGNRELARSLNREPEELEGARYESFLPASVAAERMARIEDAVLTRKPLHFEEVVGERRYIHFVSPVSDTEHGVLRIAVLSQDITERVRAQKALQESEANYRRLVNQASDGIVIIQDKLIRFANPALARMGGYLAEELDGRSFTELVFPEQVREMENFFEKRTAGKQAPEKFEVRMKRKDGSGLFVEINSTLITHGDRPAILAIIRDITERKKADLLRESLLRISGAASSTDSLDEIYRSIHMAIADLMPARNFYIALYDRETDMLSFPYFVDEIDPPPAPKRSGRGLTEYVIRTGRPLLASPQVFAELEARGEVELIGAPSIDWLGVPLLVENQTIGALVVQTYSEGVRYGEEEKDILKFVSEQVAMVIHRKRAEAQLKRSLAEKEALLKEVHHRVKNNMQVISSLLNLQARRIQDPVVLEAFRESQRRIRSMALVHERLYQSADLSRIEFSSYLRQLATHLFHSCQADSDRIRLNLQTEEVFLNINTAIPCGLIVNELVSNALKHAFPDGRGGEVGVELRRVEGDGYLIRVRDDGVGMPEGLDFRRTESLGMQIVCTLAGQIDATIDCDTRREGGGTTFSLVFNELPGKPR